MLTDNQSWYDWFNHWMSQDASNWHPIAWAVDNNPIVIGLHLFAGTVLALSFLTILLIYVWISKKQGYVNKEQKALSIFFAVFIGMMSLLFVFREICFFIPIFWLYGSVKLVTALFAFLSATTMVKSISYYKTLPTMKEMMDLRQEKDDFERKAKLLNEHINVWEQDVGYHIDLLKGQQKALTDDLAARGVPVTPLEDIHKSSETPSRAEALHSLEKIKSELNALVDSLNEGTPKK